jgi:nickel-dependent lactate racemase
MPGGAAPPALAPHLDWRRLASPSTDQPLTPAEISARVAAQLTAPTDGAALVVRPPVVIIVPDATRATGVRAMFAGVQAGLDRLGVDVAERRVLIAGGTHRPPEATEITALLGDRPAAGRFLVHDCRAQSGLTDRGHTRRGTPVGIATALFEAGTTLVIGGITGHYFAGFTGGWKGIVPGAAGYATVLANHRLAVDPTTPGGLHPACTEGQLAGNPVHADFVEAARRAPPPFLVNAVVGAAGAIVDLVSGPPDPAHARGVALARRAAVPVRAPDPGAPSGAAGRPLTPASFDLVVVETPDAGRQRDWIQSHKLVRQGAVYLRDGGTLVARLACPDGVGSETLLDWMDVPAAELARQVAARYTLHGHTALAMRALCRRVRIVLVSALAPEIVRRLGMEAAVSLEEALRGAGRRLPAGAPALWVERAGALLPPGAPGARDLATA